MQLPLPRRLALLVLVAASLAHAPAAQVGPFADGELLVHARHAVTNEYTLWRIDPATGQSGLLVTNLNAPSESGWIAYDRWRAGVLAYIPWKPGAFFLTRLWLIRADGSMTELGYTDAKLSDLAPVGDGRVYLRRDGELSLLDAANQIHPVLDAAGQPVTAPVEHLVYHAPSNALIGAMKAQSASPCSGLWHVTAHRLPLTPDGTALAGPIECSSWDFASNSWPVGIDPLPDGGLLLTLTGGHAGIDEALMRIDPVTLALTPWAVPDAFNLDGGAWLPALQRAVVLDDKDNVLRAFQQGESGAGTILPVDVAVGDIYTGHSSTEKLTDVDVAAPTCPGTVAAFGQGLAGAGGVVPFLGAGGCPEVGAPLPLTLGSGLGQATAFLGLSLGTASYPLLGGTGYLLPPLVVSGTLALDGAVTLPAVGWAEVVLPVPNDPALIGTAVYGQAAVLDAAAPAGVALTPGLQLTFG
jgi:hypothetical protein